MLTCSLIDDSLIISALLSFIVTTQVIDVTLYFDVIRPAGSMFVIETTAKYGIFYIKENILIHKKILAILFKDDQHDRITIVRARRYMLNRHRIISLSYQQLLSIFHSYFLC